MSRKPRIHFPGAVYHVMLRGNGGRDIFSSSADRSKMLFLLREGVERFGHRIHAFCLMSNHVHLVMEVGEIPLSKLAEPGKHRDGSEARAVAAMFVLGSTNLKLADLSKFLQRDLSGLSQAAGRLRKRLPEDGCLAERVEKVRIKLNEMPICQA